jgi:hypothetical protein
VPRGESFRSISLAAAILAIASPASADGPFQGSWREGPMTIQVDVQSWGGDCGPRPQSTSAPGGGTFNVSQEGDQLTFHLRRERTTRGCWSENRAVRRVSSTHQAGTWRIVCRTPPDDARAETGTYTIQAIGEDRLSFRDVSAYDWDLNESSCVATITTTQNFSRVSASNPTPEAERPREEPRPACTPGAPARIVMRPAQAEVPPGGQQCFNPRVVDAQGCPVRSQRIALALAEGGVGSLEGRCYRAAQTDGQARVVATAGSLRAEAQLTVRPLDLSDLIARRSETGSVGSGSREDARAQTAASVSARERESGIDMRWAAAGLAVAVLLVLGASIALVRRSRSKGKRSIAGLPGIDIPEPELKARGSSTPSPAPKVESIPAPGGGDMICPTCRRGYPASTAQCSHDGAQLVLYRDFVRGEGPENVCPVCGSRYAPNIKFCGKDGSTLTPADR